MVVVTTIYLIRHGEIDNPDRIIYGSSVDLLLNELGVRQIKSLGNKLLENGVKPNAIYASNLTRAIRSAEILGEILAPNLEVKQDKRLRDIDHPGLEKYTLDWGEAIPDIWHYKGPETAGFCVESREDLVARMLESLNTIKSNRQGKTVLVVSHGHPTAYLMWRLLHPHEEIFPLPNDLIRQRIYLEKAEAWKLKFDGPKFLEFEHIAQDESKGKSKERL